MWYNKIDHFRDFIFIMTIIEHYYCTLLYSNNDEWNLHSRLILNGSTIKSELVWYYIIDIVPITDKNNDHFMT